MKITKIKLLKNKVVVYFNKNRLELDKEVYPNFYLYEGKEITTSEYKKIKEYNDVSSLLKYALKVREKSLLSEYSLREKLYSRGGSKKEVDKVIKMMKSYDLIDDKAFIEEYIEYYNSKNYGKNKIITKLNEKGIFKEKLSRVNFPISIENKKAKGLLAKLEKKYEKYNNKEKKAHIYNAYIFLGFDVDIALKYSSLAKENSLKEENEKLKEDFNKAYIRLSRKYKGKELKEKLINHLLMKGYKFNDFYPLIERKL